MTAALIPEIWISQENGLKLNHHGLIEGLKMGYPEYDPAREVQRISRDEALQDGASQSGAFDRDFLELQKEFNKTFNETEISEALNEAITKTLENLKNERQKLAVEMPKTTEHPEVLFEPKQSVTPAPVTEAVPTAAETPKAMAENLVLELAGSVGVAIKFMSSIGEEIEKRWEKKNSMLTKTFAFKAGEHARDAILDLLGIGEINKQLREIEHRSADQRGTLTVKVKTGFAGGQAVVNQLPLGRPISFALGLFSDYVIKKMRAAKAKKG